MRSEVVQSNGSLSASHVLRIGAHDHYLRVVAHRVPFVPHEESIEHHLKEHQWGFGVDRRGRPLVYEARHPRWAAYPVSSFELEWDWEAVYGPPWRVLKDQDPVSVILAEGSEVEVYPHARIGHAQGASNAR